MPSNADLQAEVDRLNAENDELAAANAELSTALEAKEDAQPASTKPMEPSFGLTEGNRAELEARGHTISPFTGARLVGNGADDVREVSAEEYERVSRKAAKREDAKSNSGTEFPKSDAA